LLKSYANTLSNNNINNEDEPFATFNLTLFYLLSENTYSIAILLRKEKYASAASLLRIIIESFFNLNWVTEAENKKDISERIYQLEGTSSYLYELELEKMEENLNSDNPVWKPEAVKIIRDAIEIEKRENPFLTENKSDKIVFKSAPSFAKRMTANRIKYYHLYSFTSFFSHPTPKLKLLFIKSKNISLDELLFEPLTKTLVECFSFIVAILDNANKIFSDFNGNERRVKLLTKIKKIALCAIKEYQKKYKNRT